MTSLSERMNELQQLTTDRLRSDLEMALIGPDVLFSSEEGARARQAGIARLSGKIKRAVCPLESVLDLPEAEAAWAVFGLLLHDERVELAMIAGWYFAKRGLRGLCGRPKSDD